MPFRARSRSKLLGALGGAVVGIGLGVPFILWSLENDSLARRSYDLPFLWRPQIEVTNVAIVYLDGRAQAAQEGTGPAAGRRQYTRLLDRLSSDGASLVVMDVLFARELDPEVDEGLARAIRTYGRVVLGCLPVDSPHQTTGSAVAVQQLQLPARRLREAAAGIGLIGLHQEPVQRRLYPGTPDQASLGWAAAGLAGALTPELERRRLDDRWLNHYGPAYSLPGVSLAEAVETNGVPPGFFRGRVVFVGGHPALFPEEAFPTPYSFYTAFTGSRLQRSATSGVEIHATAYLNLLRRDWIESLPIRTQLLLVILAGALAGAGFVLVRPWHAAWMAVAGSSIIIVASFYLHWHAQRTWSWLTPAALQIPAALVWSVGYQYAVEGRRRRQIQKAFGAYLSPHLAQRIADSDFDLSPGGREVEATILFTDLEGFTSLSEGRPPAEVSRLLIAYFSAITRHIWVNDGTIIKYIGDSVMAAWGAPLPDAAGPEHGVLAACGIIEAGQKEFMGHRLRTRIGLNTGRVLAGNLGSPVRFDYTAIGATTNLASRLEGMNKILGTTILITETTRRRLSERIRVRYLGRFLIKGFREPAPIFEVLGTAEQIPVVPLWLPVFEKAMGAMDSRDWPAAEERFREVVVLRGGADGPSQFCLNFLGDLSKMLPPGVGEWDGVFRLVK